MPQEVLPVEGVTACISAFFVTDTDREESLAISSDSGDSRSSGSGSKRSGTGSGSDGRASLFGEAALDLLMVLHARLPSSLKTSSSRNTSNSGSNKKKSAKTTAALPVTAAAVPVDKSKATARAVAAAAESEGEEASSTAAHSGQSFPAETLPSARGVNGADGDSYASCIPKDYAGRGIPSLEAWIMIVRALSRGARNPEREVATHALQLLTKVRRKEDELQPLISDVLGRRRHRYLGIRLRVVRPMHFQQAFCLLTPAWEELNYFTNGPGLTEE